MSFKTAAKIFLDENRIDYLDEDHSDEELRYKTIGRVGKILTVIYTYRGEATRIISARKATPKERRNYYGKHIRLPRDEIAPEEIAELEALENIPDDEIDLSDITETTDEEFGQMRRNREIYNKLRAQGINGTREQAAN